MVTVGVSSSGAEVSMLGNGWVLLTTSEERKTCVCRFELVVPMADCHLQGAGTGDAGLL